MSELVRPFLDVHLRIDETNFRTAQLECYS
jgi:hypothetical protein